MTSFDPTAWQHADVNGNIDENEPPAPGTYDVVLRDAAAFTSKKGNDIVKAEFSLLAGPNAGHTWTVISGFSSEGATGITKAMCSRLGAPIDDIGSLDDLDTALRGCIGQYYVVDVKQNGQYTNTYVDSRLTSAPPSTDIPAETDSFDLQPAAAGTAGKAEDDDIPF